MGRFFRNEEAIEIMVSYFAHHIELCVEIQDSYVSRENFGDFKDYLAIIWNATRILNIVEPSVNVRNPARAKERVNLLKQYCGEFPKAPDGLRTIRNKNEHFDENIDAWFAKIDEDEFFYQVATVLFLYRYDPYEGVMYYLEDSVNVNDVINWVKEMGSIVK